MDIRYDTTRLVALVKARDEARALVRAAGEKYQDLRLARSEAQGRAAMVEVRATDAHSRDPNIAADLHAEVAELTRQMNAIQADENAKAAAANTTAAIAKRALAFAVEQGLDIPTTLADEAASLRRRTGMGA